MWFGHLVLYLTNYLGPCVYCSTNSSWPLKSNEVWFPFQWGWICPVNSLGKNSWNQGVYWEQSVIQSRGFLGYCSSSQVWGNNTSSCTEQQHRKDPLVLIYKSVQKVPTNPSSSHLWPHEHIIWWEHSPVWWNCELVSCSSGKLRAECWGEAQGEAPLTRESDSGYIKDKTQM